MGDDDRPGRLRGHCHSCRPLRHSWRQLLLAEPLTEKFARSCSWKGRLCFAATARNAGFRHVQLLAALSQCDPVKMYLFHWPERMLPGRVCFKTMFSNRAGFTLEYHKPSLAECLHFGTHQPHGTWRLVC